MNDSRSWFSIIDHRIDHDINALDGNYLSRDSWKKLKLDEIPFYLGCGIEGGALRSKEKNIGG